jgi:hypothetical protein
MIVESMWKHIKRRDLAQFNRPRLDLVLYLIIIGLLPRVLQTLAYVRGLRRVGRPKALAGWQVDFKAAWIDMSRTDEHRVVEKQLKWLRTPRNTKGREEHLQLLEEEEARDRGTYITDIENWVCSCRGFPKNRFLICKHLVREANKLLKNRPLTDLRFFLDLRRNHYQPYYSIPDVNAPLSDDEDDEELSILVLGQRGSSPVEKTVPASSSRAETPSSPRPSLELSASNVDAGVSEPISTGGATAIDDAPRVDVEEEEEQHSMDEDAGTRGRVRILRLHQRFKSWF